MEVSNFFPFWNKLSDKQKELLQNRAIECRADKGEIIHRGMQDCIGLMLIKKGIVRCYIISDDGKEITLFRLYEGDVCLFSASCIINSFQADIMIEAMTDCEFYKIPPNIYKNILEESAAAANYTNELMASKFTEVVWLLEQVLYKRMDSRIAAYILEECSLADSDVIKITHDEISRDLGTAREVVSRMLKYLSTEGAISVSRGNIRIIDKNKLEYIAN